jgi:putative peptidoglycan lipid II flippase
MVLAHGKDIMLALFARGNANFVQTGISGLVLSAFALSLLPFTVFYLLSRAAYAQEDTKTPFYLTVVMNIVQLLVAAVFLLTTTRGYWVVGLAVGYSIGYLVAAIGMYLQLRKPLNLNLNLVAKTAAHALLLSAPSVLLSFVIVNFIDTWLPNSAAYSLLQLVIALIVATSTFIGLNQFKPLAELSAVIKLVSRKNNG